MCDREVDHWQQEKLCVCFVRLKKNSISHELKVIGTVTVVGLNPSTQTFDALLQGC